MGARDQGHEAVEEDDAELAGEVVAICVTEDAGAVGDVDFALKHRFDEALHLGRQVLAVGVQRDNYLGSGGDHQAVAGAQGSAAAAVDQVAGHDSPPLGGGVTGAVA